MSYESNDERINRLEERFKEMLDIQRRTVDFIDRTHQSILQLALINNHLLETVNMLKIEVISRVRAAVEAQTGDPDQRRQFLDNISEVESQLDASVVLFA